MFTLRHNLLLPHRHLFVFVYAVAPVVVTEGVPQCFLGRYATALGIRTGIYRQLSCTHCSPVSLLITLDIPPSLHTPFSPSNHLHTLPYPLFTDIFLSHSSSALG
jgi:hypothetical protein